VRRKRESREDRRRKAKGRGRRERKKERETARHRQDEGSEGRKGNEEGEQEREEGEEEALARAPRPGLRASLGLGLGRLLGQEGAHQVVGGQPGDLGEGPLPPLLLVGERLRHDLLLILQRPLLRHKR
jgi:hypothetical protein